MIQTVIKRDGRIVGFNEEKIATAIRKAMLNPTKTGKTGSWFARSRIIFLSKATRK